MNPYEKMKLEHSLRANNFPVIVALNENQLNEAQEVLQGSDSLVSIGSSLFIRESHVRAFNTLLIEMSSELQQAIANDQTGEGFIKDMFTTELDRHNYGDTFKIDDTLATLRLTMKEIRKDKRLSKGLGIARRTYFPTLKEQLKNLMRK